MPCCAGDALKISLAYFASRVRVLRFGYSIGNARFQVSIWLGFWIWAIFQRFSRFIHYPPHSSSASRNPI
jgi:hypothetical protein